MKYPPVSIIILNYNGKEYLKECLDSVLTQSYGSGFEVIVVDNHSSDGSAEWLLENYREKIKVIMTDINLGFAGGNQVGYKSAENDVIVFLNNDTKVLDNWLTELIKPLLENENVGISSSKVYTPSEPDRDDAENPGINLIGHNVRKVFSDGISAFNPHGGSMAFSKSKIGFPFDTDYFLYSEDIYAGYLCHYKGFKVVWNHQSKVFHYGSVSTKKVEARFLTFLKERNRILNFLIFWPEEQLFLLTPYFIFNGIMKFSVSLLGIKYNFWGLLDAYLWLNNHHSLIEKKMKLLKLNHRLFNSDILPLTSTKLFDSGNMILKAVNYLSFSYCRIIGFHTKEFKSF